MLLVLVLGAGGWWVSRAGHLRGVDGKSEIETRGLVEDSGWRRGNIYDRNFEPMALSFRLSSLYARPLEIEDPERTAGELAGVLELEREQLLDSLRSERGFVWLTHKTEQEVVERILASDLPGVHVMPKVHRYYPHRGRGAHLLGFVKGEQGLAGLELAYDNILRGGAGDLRLAAAGIAEGPSAGDLHLVTTIDLALQEELERRLEMAMRGMEAEAAGALVMDIDSGAVLAMVSLPTYDPNHFWAADSRQRLNRLVTPLVRPGELWDIFLRAASLEQGHGDSDLLPLPFMRKLGLCGRSELDLLEGRNFDAVLGEAGEGGESCRQLAAEDEFSPVSLLVAFSRLLSGEQAVEPHLVQGFWNKKGYWPRRFAATGGVYPDSATREFLARLRDLSGAGDRVLTFKARTVASAPAVASTVTSKEEQPADVGSEVDAPGVPDLQNAREVKSVEAEKTVVSEKYPLGGGEREALELPGEQAMENRRYQSLLLALAPAGTPALAALVYVDRARMESAGLSPLAGVVRDLDTWDSVLRRTVMPPAVEAVASREEKLYQQWLSGLQRDDFQVRLAAGRQLEKMPDVVGMSLRKSLQVLQNAGLRYRVHGSGWVVAQHPVPGSSLRGADEGIIELQVPAFSGPQPTDHQ